MLGGSYARAIIKLDRITRESKGKSSSFRQLSKDLIKRWLISPPLTMPHLTFDRAKQHSPTIYYIAPDYDTPSGGIRTLYRHVDILNAEGLSARIIHHRKGFACSWFPHRTQVVGAEDVCLGPADLVVVPEVYGNAILDIPTNVRQVIFNQNAYLTFAQAGADSDTASAPYLRNPGLAAVLVVSEDNLDYMRYAFPHLRVERVHHGIDPAIFHPADHPPGKRIAFMPRRYEKDIIQVIQLLRARGALRDWELLPIQNTSPSQTADLLRSAALFLSFGHHEGFGLPPVEAMACGCIVVGFHGHGGREFLHPDWSFPLQQGNIQAVTQTVERLMREYETDPTNLQAIARRGTQFVNTVYTPARERSDLLSFFTRLMGPA